ncbi:MAG: lysophosphatidic acid receptor [Gammaproteobacteria bacterium]|nr:MAG: lysophosphatidic acid receptor [Gammaproteobacteria bacterium]
MKMKSNHRSNWKEMLTILIALAGGFLLSFLGFGLLWSGISWPIQLIMILPFFLLSYGLFRWSNNAILSCAFVFIGAAPLGLLITRFRDTNDSHLLPILIVCGWALGVLVGFYFAKLSQKSSAD